MKKTKYLKKYKDKVEKLKRRQKLLKRLKSYKKEENDK